MTTTLSIPFNWSSNKLVPVKNASFLEKTGRTAIFLPLTFLLALPAAIDRILASIGLSETVQGVINFVVSMTPMFFASVGSAYAQLNHTQVGDAHLLHKGTFPAGAAHTGAAHKNAPDLPLFLVHGLSSHPAHMKCLGDTLKGLGYAGAIYLINELKTNSDASNKGGDAVAQMIRNTIGNNPCRIIGHSRGGITGAFAARALGSQVRDLVTLGAPFKGSKFNIFSSGKTGVLHAWKSDYLKELTNWMQQESSTKFHFIAALWDFITYPSTESAIPFKGATDHTWEWGGHLSLVRSTDVARHIFDKCLMKSAVTHLKAE